MGEKKNPRAGRMALYAAAFVCALSLVAVGVCACLTADRQASFEPPSFEAAAVVGVPDVPAELGWSEVWQEGMDFKAGVCGAPSVSADGLASVWFANLSDAGAWIKLRVLDATGAVIGETGLLRPGEYVESVALDPVPAAGDAVTLEIMAYEPDTYHSLGAARLSTSLQ